ncbi:trypsin-like peptidase domain-containing protein [Streptococcus mutans]|uniref:S1C family serine protease n=1 Tax=Streptococcus mutans TaxID=1309 RepID=UPI0001B05501|nr:trypsin-like peptidase domain-containing protein [Streptococcus mutans]MCB4945866.1 trypsin-like peptidase domain-containing protein [Streptococcus mutans]MCB4958895.1 trypsin-like peptidase domain-containing protein [Streptococcus mutans]MCB4968335.1 trypsin-like peptidase domain-containing protein [Streptococcus mutans]MCB5027207.1 trypsin-like peptidase domain-containing protein [Streptococcus mutans]MCB5033713.1 trypsin-like peptidase domain-containing protein [Streptococcus mutans]
MNNTKSHPFLKWFIPFLVIFLTFILGVISTLTFNWITGNKSFSNNGKTTVSNVIYDTKSNTTKAVKNVKNTVVSVINYQKTDNNYYNYDSGSQEKNKSEDGLGVYGEGSGVIYKKDGDSAYLVTNNHVVKDAEKLEIMMANGKKVVGKLVGSDTYSDLAVIKISSKYVTTVAEFANSDKIKVGEPAIAIGSPLGSDYANSVTEGIVSSLSRTVTSQNENGETISTNAIQTDAAINPGNSGGALINIKGQVIGINSSKIASSNNSNSGVAVEGMGFAIPSNDVVSIINQLEENGEVVRPALGISMANLSEASTSGRDTLKIPSDVTSGIVVLSTQSGMPADGKLKKYDVITEIDGKKVASISDLQSILYKHKKGDKIKLTFYREKDKQTVEIQLTKTSQDLNH